MEAFTKALAAMHGYYLNPLRGWMFWDAAARAEKADLTVHDRELGKKLQQAMQKPPAEHTIAGGTQFGPASF